MYDSEHDKVLNKNLSSNRKQTNIFWCYSLTCCPQGIFLSILTYFELSKSIIIILLLESFFFFFFTFAFASDLPLEFK